MKTCRACDIELALSVNWPESYARNSDNICNSCRKIRSAAYYQEHRAEKLAYQAQYRSENLDKVKAANRSYARRHSKKIVARVARWKRENPDKVRESARRERQKHRARGRDYQRKWRRENREKSRGYCQKRRAQKRSVTIGEVDEVTIYELYDRTCIYCGSRQRLTLDYVVPLDSGGAHSEDNMVVACLSCNSGKQARTLEGWIHTQERIRPWVM